MKKQNRVHRNGGKKAGLPQAQTQPGIQQPKRAGEPSQALSKRSCVTIRIEHPSGRKFCQFDLERDVFARVEQASVKLGLTIPRFIIRCAEEKIRRDTQSGEPAAKGEGQGNDRLALVNRGLLKSREAVLAARRVA